MAEGDNLFPTDSTRDRSVLKHGQKKIINDMFENKLKFNCKFFNRVFYFIFIFSSLLGQNGENKESYHPVKVSVVTHIVGI